MFTFCAFNSDSLSFHIFSASENDSIYKWTEQLLCCAARSHMQGSEKRDPYPGTLYMARKRFKAKTLMACGK